MAPMVVDGEDEVWVGICLEEVRFLVFFKGKSTMIIIFFLSESNFML